MVATLSVEPKKPAQAHAPPATSTLPVNKQLASLAAQVDALIAECLEAEHHYLDELKQVHPSMIDSARNLAHCAWPALRPAKTHADARSLRRSRPRLFPLWAHQFCHALTRPAPAADLALRRADRRELQNALQTWGLSSLGSCECVRSPPHFQPTADVSSTARLISGRTLCPRSQPSPAPCPRCAAVPPPPTRRPSPRATTPSNPTPS